VNRYPKGRGRAPGPGNNYRPMVEPRINEEQPRQFAGPYEPPAECLDDRPQALQATPSGSKDDHSTSVRDSALGRAVQQEASDLNPGARLRAAREARGLSVEDLARITKIGASVLTALEESNVDKLPATIFTRGFLKAYASEVGLDPEETADLYLAQLMPETLAVDGAEARLKVATPAHRTEVLAYDDDTSRFLAERQFGRLGGLLTAAAAVGLVMYIWSFSWRGAPDAPDAQVAQQTTTDAARAGGPAAPMADAAPAVSAVETPIGALQFELKPLGPCWLAAAADGSPVFARLLQAGEQETIEVHDELILRVGDPGALTFSINGRPGRTLGRAGEPVNVRITKDNFREYLSS